MLSISVRNKRYNCDIQLSHKISIFFGDSGVGKSLLAKALVDPSGSYVVNTSKPCKFIELVDNSWIEVLKGSIGNDDYVYIIDDKDFIFTDEFCKLYKKVANSYFIFIVRTEYIEDRSIVWNGISISFDAIYEFVADGINHFIIPSSKYITSITHDLHNVPMSIDICLCEDKNSGYYFFKNVFNNVISLDGKDNIIEDIIHNYNLIANKNIYLAVDLAAIGMKLKSVVVYLKEIGCNIYISLDYKSFEYLVLSSKYFNVTLDYLLDNILLYDSFEKECTTLLESYTKGKIYSYNKGTSPDCFIRNCCVKDRRHLKCDIGISGDKLEYLLTGTAFEFLLKLRQVY